MTVCLCGRGADLDKVNKYLSFSPFDIILISEYVDDMKLPDCECYYIAKSEIKNTKCRYQEKDICNIRQLFYAKIFFWTLNYQK